MIQTSSRKAGDRLVRGSMFFVALLTIPGGLYGVIAQHAFLAAIVLALGLGTLWLWWIMRPRYASARAERLYRQCALLTIVFAAAAITLLVLILGSPVDGPSSSTRVRSELIAALAAMVLLTARLIAGRRLKRLAAADAAAAQGRAAVAGPAAGRASAAEAGPVPEYQLAQHGEREISQLQEQWRRGGVAPTPCLAAAPDGTLVLRPSRAELKAWRRRSAVAGLPFALVLILRVIVTGWIGAIVVAGLVAVIVTPVLFFYERRLRRGAASLTAADVIVSGWFGRPQAISRRVVKRVVMVHAELGSTRSYVVPLILLIGGDGRCLLHLSTVGVPAPDAMAFAAALQAPVEMLVHPMGPEQLRAQYPGSVSWYWQHQVLIGVLIAVAVIAIVVGVVIALAATGVIRQSG